MRRAREIAGYDYRTGRHQRLPPRVWRKRITELSAAGCRSRFPTEGQTCIFSARGELLLEVYCSSTFRRITS